MIFAVVHVVILSRQRPQAATREHGARVLDLWGESEGAETGCGKELVARALHEHSKVTGGFVTVNCGALPESLMQSELFGQVAGTFSSVRTVQLGLFRAADNGTLFLDEVDNLTLTIQGMILRALEERAVLPVGATKPAPYSARVIAGTHRALAVASGAGLRLPSSTTPEIVPPSFIRISMPSIGASPTLNGIERARACVLVVGRLQGIAVATKRRNGELPALAGEDGRGIARFIALLRPRSRMIRARHRGLDRSCERDPRSATGGIRV